MFPLNNRQRYTQSQIPTEFISECAEWDWTSLYTSFSVVYIISPELFAYGVSFRSAIVQFLSVVHLTTHLKSTPRRPQCASHRLYRGNLATIQPAGGVLTLRSTRFPPPSTISRPKQRAVPATQRVTAYPKSSHRPPSPSATPQQVCLLEPRCQVKHLPDHFRRSAVLLQVPEPRPGNYINLEEAHALGGSRCSSQRCTDCSVATVASAPPVDAPATAAPAAPAANPHVAADGTAGAAAVLEEISDRDEQRQRKD
eukprot:6214321-Pleurochrysis_carterae.AAC.4